MIPDIYLRPTDLDLSGPLAEFVRIHASAGAASAGLTLGNFYAVPRAKLLVVQSFAALADPGAGQNVVYVRIQSLSNAVVFVINTTGRTTADIEGHVSLQSPIWIPEGTSLQVEALYNSGVASNSLEAWMTGWLIPRSSVII